MTLIAVLRAVTRGCAGAGAAGYHPDPVLASRADRRLVVSGRVGPPALRRRRAFVPRMVPVLSRATTLHALLEEFPFLGTTCAACTRSSPVSTPVGRGPGWARWSRVADLATTMDRPWPELLRDLQAEVRRVTGAAPPISEDAPGDGRPAPCG